MVVTSATSQWKLCPRHLLLNSEVAQQKHRDLGRFAVADMVEPGTRKAGAEVGAKLPTVDAASERSRKVHDVQS